MAHFWRFDKCLERAALKHWSKYTAGKLNIENMTVLLLMLNNCIAELARSFIFIFYLSEFN